MDDSESAAAHHSGANSDYTQRATLVIGNPAAGRGRLAQQWPRLRASLDAAVGPCCFHLTHGPGHATELAATALVDRHALVVAVGGDGTVHEVVNGLMQIAERPPLGILHFGSGGDLCRSLNIPRRLDRALTLLRSRRAVALDVGQVTFETPDDGRQSRYFVNAVNFGLGGIVDRLMADHRQLGGSLAYLVATLRALRGFSARPVRVREGSAEPRDTTIFNMAVTNGRYVGGGMNITPEASLRDGLLDIAEISPRSAMDLILNSHHFYRGTQQRLSWVRLSRSDSLSVEPLDEAVLMDIDGEAIGQLPASFSVVPQALPVICSAV